MSGFHFTNDTQAIREWLSHGAVATDRLADELRAALAHVSPPPPSWTAPTGVTLVEQLPTETEIADWLGTLGFQIWADCVISERAGQERAAVWLAKQMRLVTTFVRGTRAK